MGRINIEVEEDIHRKMKSVCALKGIVLKDFISDALQNYMEKAN